jgi:hypothetical protein
MYRIGLITSDSTLTSIFDPVLPMLGIELVVATPDSNPWFGHVDLLLWHDTDAVGYVPTHLAVLGIARQRQPPNTAPDCVKSQIGGVANPCDRLKSAHSYYFVGPLVHK